MLCKPWYNETMTEESKALAHRGTTAWFESPEIMARAEGVWDLYSQGLTLRAISAKVGVSVPTVRRDIKRAQALLRARTTHAMENAGERAVTMREQIHQELMTTLVNLRNTYHAFIEETDSEGKTFYKPVSYTSAEQAEAEVKVVAQMRQNADGYEKLQGLVQDKSTAPIVHAERLHIVLNAKGDPEFVNINPDEYKVR